MTITQADRNHLIRLARETILRKLNPRMTPNTTDEPLTESVKVKCGAFVSVYVNSKLRGCIGTFSEDAPLHRNVCNMALSAATSDTRFSPIDFSEVDDLKIEISVLSPRKLINDISEIVLGKHGIYIRKGINRGTLLPQVAISQRWTVDEFLGNCARYKAGIGWDGWKTAEVYTYEAIVFNSEEV